MKKEKGLTLIELLIVIVVIGILASVAIPIYTNYMQRARRSEAKTALEQIRAAQEVFRAERGRYANDGDDGNAWNVLNSNWGGPSATIGNYYNLSFTVMARNSFTAAAQPVVGSRQDGDGGLFINHLGQKWDSDGSFYPAGKWAK
jgi:type IV pilus assembly protein PilE